MPMIGVKQAGRLSLRLLRLAQMAILSLLGYYD